jgi:hypothetical protein
MFRLPYVYRQLTLHHFEGFLETTMAMQRGALASRRQTHFNKKILSARLF